MLSQYMQIFMFVSVSVSIIMRICRFFFNIISFRHVLHFGVGRSQMEWNMKVKGQILICTAIMLNDHSNPYIESTTVLSDNINLKADLCRFNHHVHSITSACLMGILNILYNVSHTLSECKRVDLDQSRVLGPHGNSLALPTHFPSQDFS